MYIKKAKSISFVIGMICLTISMIVFVNNSNNNDIVNKPDVVETINKEYKIGINTNFTVITKYQLCNHTIEEKKEITKDMLNLTYEDIQNKYVGYEIVEFDNDRVILQHSVNEYCGDHYLLKETNNKIGVYRLIDDNNFELIQIIDVDIDTLRQSDRYMFKTTGVRVNGQDNLYKFLEDFDS